MLIQISSLMLIVEPTFETMHSCRKPAAVVFKSVLFWRFSFSAAFGCQNWMFFCCFWWEKQHGKPKIEEFCRQRAIFCICCNCTLASNRPSLFFFCSSYSACILSTSFAFFALHLSSSLFVNVVNIYRFVFLALFSVNGDEHYPVTVFIRFLPF